MTLGNWHVITFVACMPRLLSIEVRMGVKRWWKPPTPICCLKTGPIGVDAKEVVWWLPASLISRRSSTMFSPSANA